MSKNWFRRLSATQYVFRLTQSKIKEEKNIKRRVYDALNVLISVGVIEKKSKKISIREHTSVGTKFP